MNTSTTRIPVEQIRGPILATGVSSYELARRLGWMRPHGQCLGQPDASRVQWVLGLKGNVTLKNGVRYGPYRAVTASHTIAVALVRAAGLDPIDVGL